MKKGDRCLLKDAPKNAILRAVWQLRYAVPWYFVVLEDGRQPRVHPLDAWIVEKNGMQNRQAADVEIQIIDFFEGELEEREWQAY